MTLNIVAQMKMNTKTFKMLNRLAFYIQEFFSVTKDFD